jgi:hypothetical protein
MYKGADGRIYCTQTDTPFSALTKADAYDEPDDLLDPRNARHTQWLNEQHWKPSGDSTPSDETS